MAVVRLLTHLPLLRIVSDRCALGDGWLWAPPFDEYDQLLAGSFTDAAAAYRATDPVFFVTEADLEVPASVGKDGGIGRGLIDVSTRRPLSLLFLADAQRIHDHACRRAWKAINLAAPHIASPDPALSLHIADIPSSPPVTWTQQGDADQELLFLAYAASVPLDDDTIGRAVALLPVVDRANDALAAAISALCAAGAPSLDADAQLTVCTTALESLLVPDVTAGTGRAFRTRLANLLGRDEPERTLLDATAKALFAARSSTVHGRGGGRRISAGTARSMLARSVVAVDGLLVSGAALDALRTRLGDGPASADRGAVVGDSELTISRRPCLTIPRSGTAPVSSSLTISTRGLSVALPPVAAGELAVFTPLVGLNMPAFPNALVAIGFPLTWLELQSISAMEDPDIRRDWIASVTTSASQPVPCLAWRVEAAERWFPTYDGVDALLTASRRQRDLAVIALRLAGLSRFIDPELVGEYVLSADRERFRFPTIYRQTVIVQIGDRVETLDEQHVESVAASWAQLGYGAGPADSGVERALMLLRRAHHVIGVTSATRLRLLFASIDIAFDFADVDGYAAAISGLRSAPGHRETGALEWYEEHGLATRNAVAHGYWDPNDMGPRGGAAIEQVLAVTRAALTSMMASRSEPSDATAERVAAARHLRYGITDTTVMLERGKAAQIAGDADAARSWYSQADGLGNPLGAFHRATVERDLGDLDAASRWFSSAAKRGVTEAMTEMGVLERRRGNLAAARQWYQRAIAGGDERAGTYNLGVLEQVAGNVEAARHLFRRAAKLGEHKAMRNLGLDAEQSGDLDSARRWFKQAAKAGSANAMNDLGVLAAQSGDMREAASWWRRACEAGDPNSALSLAFLARDADDMPAARKWLQRAAKLGNEQAVAFLAELDPDVEGS